MSVGDTLKVVTLGESLIDETTGLDLGSTEKTVGTVEVRLSNRPMDQQDKYETIYLVIPGFVSRGLFPP